MRGSRALLASLSLLAAAGTPAAQAPPCAVEAMIEPAEPVVGEQVLWRARISRRSDVAELRWEQAPRFPGWRSAWLPGRVEDTQSSVQGSRYLQREDQRALFATRPGLLRIPAMAMLCELEGSAAQGSRTLRIPLPASELRVSALPEAGRPPGFRGLVGPVTVQAHVDRSSIELGESVRLSVLLHGATNLWDAVPPHPELDSRSDLEVFREASTSDQQAGDKLYVRRPFRIDLVPRTPGILRIPETRVAFYDPQRRRYDTARAAPLEVRVLAASEVAPTDRTGAATARSDPASNDASWPVLQWILAALGLALIVALAALLRRHTRAPRFAAAEAALATAEADDVSADPRAQAARCARALRAALASAAPDCAGLDSDALLAHTEAQALRHPERLAAARLLVELDRCRFAAEPERPDLDAVRASVAALEAAR